MKDGCPKSVSSYFLLLFDQTIRKMRKIMPATEAYCHCCMAARRQAVITATSQMMDDNVHRAQYSR